MKIKYNPELKELARTLRNNSTKAEIKLWHYIKGRQLMGYDFHRQKPIEEYIKSLENKHTPLSPLIRGEVLKL